MMARVNSRLGPSAKAETQAAGLPAGPSRGFSRAYCGGFALLTVLWLIVALSGIVGVSIALSRLGQQTSVNWITLARGRWAAEACLAIAQARWAAGRFADTATIDLGQGKACRWRAEDPTARVNVNVADAELLSRLAVPALSAAPFESLDEVAMVVRDSAALGLLTVDGPGTINVNAAPAPVLGALPGVTSEAVERVLYRRGVGRPVAGLDDLAGELSPPARAALLDRYADLARTAVFSPPQLVVTSQGWVAPDGGPERLHATIEVLVVPLPERLAVIRRRMW